MRDLPPAASGASSAGPASPADRLRQLDRLRRLRLACSTGAVALSCATSALLGVGPAAAAPVPHTPSFSVVAGGGPSTLATATTGTGADVIFPESVALERSSGDLYIGSSNDGLVARLTPSGAISVVAGGGLTSLVSATAATDAQLFRLSAVAADSAGNVYFAEQSADVVAKVTPSGRISVVAGGGATAVGSATAATSAQLDDPSGLAVDPAGNVFIATAGDGRVVKVTPSGGISVVAGGGSTALASASTATSARLSSPGGVAVDSSGNVFVAATGDGRVAKVTPSGGISVIAGGGSTALASASTATSAQLVSPGGVSVTPDGDVYIAVTGSSRIARVTSAGAISVVAGGGAVHPASTANPTSAQLDRPSDVAASATGDVYIADHSNNLIEKATVPSGTVPTIVLPAMSRAGTVGSPYTLPVGVSAGSSAVTWSITAGSLPPGLALDTATGAVRGTPTAAGTTTFDITATTAAGRDTESTAIIVLPAPPSSGARPGLPPQQLSTGSPLVVGLGARTFALNAVATGAGSTTGQGVAGGRLSYSSASPAVCSVDASGVVTALKAGTCSVSITAAATSTHSAAVKTLDVTITDARTSVVALPAGPQRFAGADRVATSADIASKVFTTPSTGASRDVVIATAASYADALPGARLAGQVGGPLLLTDAGRLSEQAAAQVERLVAAGGTVYVLGGDRALSAAVQQATDGLVAGDSVVRLSGGDRFETAVAVADATTRRAGDVGPLYLVTGRDFADGVSVAAYAQSTGGVVLLTDGGTMPAVTAAYLAAHDPTGTRAIAIGGPARAAAASAGLVGAVERAVVGADRFETSAQLSAAMRAAATGIPSTATGTATSTATSTASGTVGLAGGTSWPDALSGSAAMAALGGPLLLTATGVDAVPASTASALGRIQAERVLVFGGASAVTEGAYGRAGALLGT